MSDDKSPEAFRTIGEVAAELEVPQHVLRFWETKFPQVKPLKRAGGRRYYRPQDVALLKGIRRLLYGEGFTIRGAQRVLKEKGGRHVSRFGAGEVALDVVPAEDPAAASPHKPRPGTGETAPADPRQVPPGGGGPGEAARAELAALLAELMDLKRILDGAR